MTKFKITIVPYDILHSLIDILRFALELPLFSVYSLLLTDYRSRQQACPFGDIDPAHHAIPYSWVSGGEVRGPSWGGLPPSVVGDPDAASRVSGDYAANCLYNHPNFPDGFLPSSMHQLCHYAQAYLSEGRHGAARLLRAETIGRMFQAESGDETRVIGLCWNAQRRAGRDLLWGHGGSDPGINANLRLRFEDGVAAIVLMNTNVGRPGELPAPLEFAEYLVDHSYEF